MRRAAFLIGRITADRFVHLPLQLSGDARVRRVHEDDALFGQRAVLRLHFVVFENNRDRFFSLSIDVGRLLQDHEILACRWWWAGPRIDSTCFFDIPSATSSTLPWSDALPGGRPRA